LRSVKRVEEQKHTGNAEFARQRWGIQRLGSEDWRVRQKGERKEPSRYDCDSATQSDNSPGPFRIAASKLGDVLRRRDAESQARENAEHADRALDHAVFAELLTSQEPGCDDGCGQI
jgi:hypothetical protein